MDADAIAREVVEPGTPGFAAVVERFGDAVVSDGRLDRPALARLVFDDDQARADLNAIVHPLVGTRSAELMAQAPPDALVVYDVPLLVESGLAGGFDVVVIVLAPEDVRLKRLEAAACPRRTPAPGWPSRRPTSNGGRSPTRSSPTTAPARNSKPRSTPSGTAYPRFPHVVVAAARPPQGEADAGWRFGRASPDRIESTAVRQRGNLAGCARGRSAAGSASPCQGEGRGFESRRPLEAPPPASTSQDSSPAGLRRRGRVA